jgi:hypothetical protein
MLPGARPSCGLQVARLGCTVRILPVAGKSGTAQRQPQPTTPRNLLRPAIAARKLAHRGTAPPTRNRAPVHPAPRAPGPPEHPESEVRREEGAVGNQEYQESVIMMRFNGLREPGCQAETRRGPSGVTATGARRALPSWEGCGGAARGGHGHEERISQIKRWQRRNLTCRARAASSR